MPGLTFSTAFHDASDDAIRSAFGLAAILTWVIGAPHMYLFNSRTVYSSLALIAICLILVLVGMSLIKPLQQLLLKKTFIGCCGGIALVCGIVFVLNYLSSVKLLCATVQSSACFLMLLGWGASISTLRGSAIARIGYAALVIASLATLLFLSIGYMNGLTENTNTHTTVMIVLYSLLPALSALAYLFNAQTDIAHKRTQAHRSASAQQQEPETASAQASEKATRKARKKKRPQTRQSGFAWTTVILMCAGCLTASFFDGITFNPYVTNALGISVWRAFIGGIGGFILMTLAFWQRTGRSRLRNTSLGAALPLVLAIVGILLFTLSPSTLPDLSVALILAAGDLLLVDLIVMVCSWHASVSRITHILGLMLAGGSGLWCLALGLYVKRVVGYSVDSITPIVIIVLAVLAGVALLAGTRSGAEAASRTTRSAPSYDLAGGAASVGGASADLHLEIIVDNKRLTDTLDRYDLTEHEKPIALLAMQGLSNADIAQKVGVTPSTVSYHLTRIFQKLDVRSKKELARKAQESIALGENAEDVH